MNDSHIIYAFVLTVVGCLISITAGLVAIYKTRGTNQESRLSVTKSAYATTRPVGFYGKKAKPVPLDFGTALPNQIYTFNFDELLLHTLETTPKPTARIILNPSNSESLLLGKYVRPHVQISNPRILATCDA